MTNKKGRTERHDPKRNDPCHSTGPLRGWHNPAFAGWLLLLAVSLAMLAGVL
jgi:hypothetical protein